MNFIFNLLLKLSENKNIQLPLFIFDASNFINYKNEKYLTKIFIINEKIVTTSSRILIF